jgi:hypothetical protein
MYVGHNSECAECFESKGFDWMTKKILSLDSIMVNRCVSLFVLSKIIFYINTKNASQVQMLKG